VLIVLTDSVGCAGSKDLAKLGRGAFLLDVLKNLSSFGLSLHVGHRRRWSRTVFLSHMGGHLVLGLIIISVSGLFWSYLSFCVISVLQTPGMCVKSCM
jgi:hypothetical protein